MYADLDELVLSGKLFSQGSPTGSPRRSPSPDAWPPEGYQDEEDDGSESENKGAVAAIIPTEKESIGMGPGRTGIKGVLRDRAEADSRARAARAAEITELNARMEKAALTGASWAEEEKMAERERARLDSKSRYFRTHFGHLREVGSKGFVKAVEEEDSSVFVVVHIYDSVRTVPRLYQDDKLADLARLHPRTKFLRAKASSLGYATTSSRRPARLPGIKESRRRAALDEDDPYGDEDADDEDEKAREEDDAESEDIEVDRDVLPTMHIYRRGQLVHNWVRVDWVAGTDGIEELLRRHNILSGVSGSNGNLGLPSDDEYEELDSGGELEFS